MSHELLFPLPLNQRQRKDLSKTVFDSRLMVALKLEMAQKALDLRSHGCCYSILWSFSLHWPSSELSPHLPKIWTLFLTPSQNSGSILDDELSALELVECHSKRKTKENILRLNSEHICNHIKLDGII